MEQIITTVGTIDNEQQLFEVSLHNYDNEVFHVNAFDPQEALDEVVDYMEAQDMLGLFYEDNGEVEELEEEGWEFITAGNHCYYLDAEHTHIREVV